VTIRRSAAARTQELLDALASSEATIRDAAAARLGTIGPRAVAHLTERFHASSSAVERVTILKILESIRDRRALGLAIDLMAAPTRDPAVVSAAIGLLGTFLDDEGTLAIEALGAIVVDQERPELERVAAWRVLERMPERILAPLRKRLSRDCSAAMRQTAGAPPAEIAAAITPLDPVEWLESAARGAAADPAVIVASLAGTVAKVPLSTLHRLTEITRTRQDEQTAAADRQEWLVARGAVHLALAQRGSRVAVYDVRDSVERAQTPLPDTFTTALALVGDADCLEPLADAVARTTAGARGSEHEWRDRLIETGRAIVARERVTRRHPVARRLLRKLPDVAGLLLR
jgi:hypothetical protein